MELDISKMWKYLTLINSSAGQYQENDDDMVLISNIMILWYITILSSSILHMLVNL